MSPQNYVTTREAARLLGVTATTIQRWVERGQLQSWTTAGGHRRVARSAVQRALDQKGRTAGAASAPYRLPVLVVEDDVDLLRLYRHHMSTWSFGVDLYVSPNGHEAALLIGEVQPRLLVCDLGLPGLDGFGVVRGICAMPSFENMGIAVVTGLTHADIAYRGGLPDRAQVMGKPIDFGRLEAMALALWQATNRDAPALSRHPFLAHPASVSAMTRV